LTENKADAIKSIEEYVDIFGDDFYLEIQDHGLEEEKVYNDIYNTAKDMGIRVVATNDTHFLTRENHRAHHALLCIQTNRSINDKTGLQYSHELYLKSADEMYKLFKDKPDAIENSLLITEKCNVELKFGEILLPQYPLPVGKSPDEYLRELASVGLKKRYPNTKPIETRFEYELGVIKSMGYASYFLVVWDFIRHAKAQGIPVGGGRGSVAGSIVAYAMGITEIDPIKYNLLFERFLNPSRVSMPDIDVDFCYERRGEIVEYVKERYGSEKVSNIITFGTLQSRAAIKDRARVFDYSFNEADALSKEIPVHQGKPMSVKEAFTTVPELEVLYSSHQELVDTAMQIEGAIRQPGVHAAGIVIAPDEITNYAPLYMSRKNEIATQYDMYDVENIGLLKMDFLGLRTLTVVADTLKLINKSIKMSEIPMNDSKTFQLFRDGNTTGIFQFESDGMQEFLRKFKPDCIEDLIAINALYRPGPIQFIDEFVERKKDPSRISYLHPKMKQILEKTYGIIVYQEQVMQIASELAGFSMAEADNLRKAMGKKIPKLMKKMKKKFIDGCVKNDIDENTASDVADLIERFAEYGFKRAHSHSLFGFCLPECLSKDAF